MEDGVDSPMNFPHYRESKPTDPITHKLMYVCMHVHIHRHIGF